MAAPVRRSGQPLLLACDLDGTLLDHDSAPVPGVGAALTDLIAAGALFAVVTGRPLLSARRATTTLGVEPLMYACYHGALVVETGGAVIRHQPLPAGPARAVAAEVLARGVAVTVWDGDEPRELEPGTSRGDWHDDELGDRVSRLVLHGDPASTVRLLPELRAEWSGRLRVEAIRPGFLGVFAPEVDKGDALRLIAARLGVSPGRTVACGDGTADETLLAAAAVRIAVGGRPHVLGHLPDVVVTDWARLPETLRARVLPLL
jgi:hydroxymethylpyrimidine pyrophosphatase-like HAD family hydrolase